MDVRSLVRSGLRRCGVEVHRADRNVAAERRLRLLRYLAVPTVVDVGANVGQYARGLRSVGFAGEIVSFEPIPAAFAELREVSAPDDQWSVHHCAVGSADGTVELNVAADSVSSSVLASTSNLTDVLADARARERVEVPLRRLDGFGLSGPMLLKIDTQGYEEQVLEGAAGVLDQVRVLDVELAFVELYEGGSSVYRTLPLLHELGFDLVHVDPGYTDPRTGGALDGDFLLVRR